MNDLLRKKTVVWPAFGIFVLICAYTILITYGSIKSDFFDGYFANGSFQVFDPLRRIAAGQIPGRDFMIFHGIGTTLVHYPIFAAFGENLYASEISRMANSPFFYILSPFIVAFLASRSLAFAFSATIVMLLIGPLIFLQLYDPANSMLGVRSGFAVFACSAFLIASPRRRMIGATLLIALAIIGSTEQGVAIVVGTSLVGILTFAARRSVVVIGSAIAGMLLALVIFALFARDRLFEFLRFYYTDIPGDQPWYFGADPNPFGVNGFIHMFGEPKFKVLALISLTCLVLVAAKLLKESLTDRVIASLVFVAYGAVTLGTMNGYVFYGNMEPFARACIFAALVAWTPRIETSRRLDVTVSAAFLASVLFLFAPNHHRIFNNMPVLGVHLAKRWETHLTEINARVPAKETLWSDYAGLIEATHAGFQPASDYIIHALGPRRREEYAALFKATQPDWVRLNNVCSWSYGIWLQNENWPFYKQVISEYDPVYSDTLGVLFHKTKPVDMSTPSELTLDQDGCVTQAANQDGLWEISIDYALQPPSKIGIINSIPRYLVEQTYVTGAPVTATTSVSLPLKNYGRHWSFPLRLQAGARVKLCPVVRSNFGTASFSFMKVESREMYVSKAMLDYMNCTGKEFAYIAH
jgi:hypothetical protein